MFNQSENISEELLDQNRLSVQLGASQVYSQIISNYAFFCQQKLKSKYKRGFREKENVHPFQKDIPVYLDRLWKYMKHFDGFVTLVRMQKLITKILIT